MGTYSDMSVMSLAKMKKSVLISIIKRLDKDLEDDEKLLRELQAKEKARLSMLTGCNFYEEWGCKTCIHWKEFMGRDQKMCTVHDWITDENSFCSFHEKAESEEGSDG